MVWTNYTSTLTENQDKIALPLNSITENLYYTDSTDKKNQRVVVSAPTKYPLVWQISKVEALDPMGIQVITIYQDLWNKDTDYIDTAEQEAGDLFAMYADYYSSTVEPTDPDTYPVTRLELTCNSNTIKAGGSYKLITATLYNSNDEDITDQVVETEWACYLNGEDITDDESLITWLAQDEVTQMKIKFANDRNHYTEILTVRCTTVINNKEISGDIQLEISAL